VEKKMSKVGRAGADRDDSLKGPSNGHSGGANSVGDKRCCPSFVILRKDHLDSKMST
jgi:hypothetical protein